MRILAPNPSGGLFYHLLAWRRSRLEWESYRQQMGKWVLAREFRGRSILIVGPSGGYTLAPNIFRNFKNYGAFDVDPWARFFFRKLHREAKITWRQEDFFQALSRHKGSLHVLLDEIGLPRDSVIFFANVLGQLEYLRKDYSELQCSLGQSLREVEWVSVHDRLCTRLSVKSGAESGFTQSERLQDSIALTKRCFEVPSQQRSSGSVLEVEEHDLDALWATVGLAGESGARPQAEWAYFPWRIRQDWTHLVEAVHCLPMNARS